MKPNQRLHLSIPCMAAALTLGACQTPPQRTGSPMNDIDAALNEGVAGGQAAAVQPPPVVTDALLPPINIGLPEPAPGDLEPRFDLAVNHAPAQEFFMSLVEGTRYNMVVHPSVAGEITLRLKNVTVHEVMEAVRNVYGYEYAHTGQGFEVLPMRLQSRIFQVSYLNVKRSGKSQTRVNSGQVSEVASTSADSGGDTGSGGGGSEARTVPSSRIETDTVADFWQELQGALLAIIGSEEGRSVVVSPQSGVVVVRALPSELREVERFLDASQANLQRQVILEAKILEVELSDGFQSGINWAALGEVGDGKTALFGQTGGGTLFSDGRSEIAGNTGTLDPTGLTQVQNTDTSAFGGVFSIALNLNDFNAFIELLKTQGNVQVLSSPRVSTLNNQKAVIKVGSDEFFVTDVSTNTTTGTAVSTNRDVTLTPFFSGIALDVTPQINAQGNITLHVHPSVSEVTDQIKTISFGGGEGDELTLPLAFSTVRESDSIVRADSGQVVVIGGLMQNQSRDETAATPVLGDIPVIGNAFKHKRKSARKSELVILLRPVVIENGQGWSQQLEQSSTRMRGLDSGTRPERRPAGQ